MLDFFRFLCFSFLKAVQLFSPDSGSYGAMGFSLHQRFSWLTALRRQSAAACAAVFAFWNLGFCSLGPMLVQRDEFDRVGVHLAAFGSRVGFGGHKFPGDSLLVKTGLVSQKRVIRIMFSESEWCACFLLTPGFLWFKRVGLLWFWTGSVRLIDCFFRERRRRRRRSGGWRKWPTGCS